PSDMYTLSLHDALPISEVVPWWAVVALPAAIAVMVKVNDLVAGAVLRSAAGVAEREQQRLRQLVTPAVGRAPVRRARGYARCGADRKSTRLNSSHVKIS